MHTQEERKSDSRAAAHAESQEDSQAAHKGVSLPPPPVQFSATQPIQRNDWNKGMDIIREQGLGRSLREAWDYLTEDDLEDAQEVIGDIDTGLSRSSQALTVAEAAFGNATHRARISRFRGVLDRMQRYTSGALQVGEVYNNLRTFRELLDAIEDMPDNVRDDPQGAADAFGRITASLGTLGGLLPSGPWSGYFSLLAGSRNFFNDMYRQVNVDAITEDRFRRQGIDQSDPGGIYTNRRGTGG